MNVLLSIRPQYAESIISGQKKYEFRKIIFNDKYVNIAYVYVTSPVKKIVCTFKVGKIVRDCPENLWDQLNEFSGLDEAEFFAYFKKCKVGYAIEIKHVETFDEPIDPKELIPNFNPQQSFCYIKSFLNLEVSCERSILSYNR